VDVPELQNRPLTVSACRLDKRPAEAPGALLADDADDIERVRFAPGVEGGVLLGDCRRVDADAPLVPVEGIGGVPDVGARPGGADGGDRLDRVPALGEQDGEAERRAAVDAHVAWASGTVSAPAASTRAIRDCPTPTFSQLETGDREPALKTMRALAPVLDVRP